ncbi:MAG: PDZ domain-containing protein, partial [Woeseiaceae bacterium]|nr:PDZ domain-containing protein [Woeseiaceae bacterium]
RLDRRAPDYGRGKYNDFNTFYFQAASGTSGGSSGSPVINIEGEVVALNAGANSGAASSFFLPLDRVERALKLIQDGRQVTRGTLQTIFMSNAYDELRRLGLSEESEALAREANPEATGMLSVQQVIPESAADKVLQVGDILLRVNGELVTEFVPLAAILDEQVGKTVSIEVERGGRKMRASLPVEDLHGITPDEYLEFGDVIVNDLSYQQARHYNRPIRGIYVANPGYMFGNAAIPRGAVISEVDGAAVRNIGELERQLDRLADGDRAAVRFYTMDEPRNSVLRSVEMDRDWFPARHCQRDDTTGLWPCRTLSKGPPPSPPESGQTSFSGYDDPRIDAIAPSMVMVTFDLPYSVSGVADRNYYGTGLIVDAERGLVIVDRNTVPLEMGDVTVTFAGSLQVKGDVRYVHPLHNLSIVAYDPALIGDTPVRSAVFDVRPMQPGQAVWVAGLKGDHQLVHQEAIVASVEPMLLPLSRTFRFRDSNLESISLVNGPNEFDGVVINDLGQVLAMWSSFAFQAGSESEQVNRGVASELVSEFVDIARSDKSIYSLEAEFGYLPLFAARKLGLDDEWLSKLEQHNPQGRRALSVSRLVAGTPASSDLRNGDMVLAVDGKVVTTFRELERAVQGPKLRLTVWRDGRAQDIDTKAVSLDGSSLERVVAWAGALLQDPHREMAAQRGIEPYGVYVAFFSYGSPATRYGLWAGRRIVEVDEVATPDLQTFLDVVARKRDQASVRLKTITWNDAVEVITLKLDNQYWPAYEIRKTANGWQRFDIG